MFPQITRAGRSGADRRTCRVENIRGPSMTRTRALPGGEKAAPIAGAGSARRLCGQVSGCARMSASAPVPAPIVRTADTPASHRPMETLVRAARFPGLSPPLLRELQAACAGTVFDRVQGAPDFAKQTRLWNGNLVCAARAVACPVDAQDVSRCARLSPVLAPNC
jgi:hypothetical protein